MLHIDAIVMVVQNPDNIDKAPFNALQMYLNKQKLKEVISYVFFPLSHFVEIVRVFPQVELAQ